MKETIKDEYTISIEPKSYEHYFFINNKFNINVAFSYKKFYSSRNKHAIVVRKTNNNYIVAVSVITITYNNINIDYTIVDKEYRRKGINKKILSFIENIAVNQNINKLTANIRHTNEKSLISFTKHGFIPYEETGVYKNGDIKVFMCKDLYLPVDKHFKCECGNSDFWFFWNRTRCKKCLTEYRETSFISKIIRYKTPFIKNKWFRKFNSELGRYNDWKKFNKL